MPGCSDCEREGLDPGRAAVVSPDCRCGHPASQHRGGTYACRDCGCHRYEPDIAGVALAQTESTSARLARVTAERDELAQQLRAVNDERTAALAAVVRVRRARDIAEAERDQAKQSLAEALDQAGDAERECAELRLELQHVHCRDKD